MRTNDSSPEMLFRFYAAESTLTHAEDGPAGAACGFTAAGQKVSKKGGEGRRWRAAGPAK